MKSLKKNSISLLAFYLAVWAPFANCAVEVESASRGFQRGGIRGSLHNIALKSKDGLREQQAAAKNLVPEAVIERAAIEASSSVPGDPTGADVFAAVIEGHLKTEEGRAEYEEKEFKIACQHGLLGVAQWNDGRQVLQELEEDPEVVRQFNKGTLDVEKFFPTLNYFAKKSQGLDQSVLADLLKKKKDIIEKYRKVAAIKQTKKMETPDQNFKEEMKNLPPQERAKRTGARVAALITRGQKNSEEDKKADSILSLHDFVVAVQELEGSGLVEKLEEAKKGLIYELENSKSTKEGLKKSYAALIALEGQEIATAEMEKITTKPDIKAGDISTGLDNLSKKYGHLQEAFEGIHQFAYDRLTREGRQVFQAKSSDIYEGFLNSKKFTRVQQWFKKFKDPTEEKEFKKRARAVLENLKETSSIFSKNLEILRDPSKSEEHEEARRHLENLNLSSEVIEELVDPQRTPDFSKKKLEILQDLQEKNKKIQVWKSILAENDRDKAAVGMRQRADEAISKIRARFKDFLEESRESRPYLRANRK